MRILKRVTTCVSVHRIFTIGLNNGQTIKIYKYHDNDDDFDWNYLTDEDVDIKAKLSDEELDALLDFISNDCSLTI